MKYIKDIHRFGVTLILLAAAVPAFGQGEPAAHSETQCAGCHSRDVSPQRSADLVARQCTTCHDAGSLASASAVSHSGVRNRCLDCHSFHEPSVITVAARGGIQVPIGAMDSGHCRSCHSGEGSLASLSPAHRKAAELYHDQARQLQNISPSQACLNCHSNLSASDWQGRTDGAVLAFNEHASHPYGVRVVPGSGNSSNWIAYEIDPRLPLFDQRMECQTCHSLTAANDDLMIPFETKYDLCKGCHRQYGDDTAGQIVAGLGR